MFLANHETLQNGLGHMDDRLLQYLQSLDGTNSFVVLMGDHGLNYGTYAQVICNE